MPTRTHQITFNSNGLYRKTLLYRVKLAGQNVKIEMHFYENKLFYYKFIFSYAKAEDRRVLSNALIEKYNLPNIDLSSHTIFDQQRNCIQIEDYIEFTISYTQMENPIFELVEEIKTKSHFKMVAQYNQQSRALFSSL